MADQTPDIGRELGDQRRNEQLDALLAFVRDALADTNRGLTCNLHRLPVELFGNDAFESMRVETRDSGHHYLVGVKNFGDRQVTGFSVDLEGDGES